MSGNQSTLTLLTSSFLTTGGDMDEIILQGDKQHLVEILESHIAYLKACGYEDHKELNYCYEFLMQLDDSSEMLQDIETEY